MGGAIAIGYGLKYPEKVKALFPISSWGVTQVLPVHILSYLLIQKTNLTLWQYKLLGKNKWLVEYMLQHSLIGSKRKITNKLINEVQKACQEENAGRPCRTFKEVPATKKVPFPVMSSSFIS